MTQAQNREEDSKVGILITFVAGEPEPLGPCSRCHGHATAVFSSKEIAVRNSRRGTQGWPPLTSIGRSVNIARVQMAQENVEMPGLFETKPCLLCGDQAAEVVYAYPADYYDHARWETASWDGRISAALSIVRCTKCALMYSRPSFREQALEHVYPQDLVDPELSFERALTLTRAKHKKMLAELSPLRSGGSLCDIGTRYGVLPYLAREAGYDGFGIEYNAASVRVARAASVPVYQGSVHDLPRVLKERRQAHVDTLVLDDVLEHLVDPLSALRTLRSCQQPGGLLMLQQMDLDSLGHRLFQRHWYYLQPAAHMFYFSERSLRALLDRVGYDVRRVVRPALFRNVRRTVSRTLPGAALKLARARARGTHKPSYLSLRLRSADDMFLVVAERRAD
jgi:2-polyprenyl-3-methyl-5-hydroxy-6-metoxy-1,4-benzoquinol methylase